MLLISVRKIIMLKNYSANNTAKTVYKISGYYNHSHKAADNNYTSSKAKDYIHPSMDGSCEPISSALLVFEGKVLWNRRERLGTQFSFVYQGWFLLWIFILSHGPSSDVRWCMYTWHVYMCSLCTTQWNHGRPVTQTTKDWGFAGHCLICNRLKPWVWLHVGLSQTSCREALRLLQACLCCPGTAGK